MSKYDRDIQDVYAVKQLGDAIGYGHLMAIAYELWARHLESKGLPRRGAHCVVGYPMVKEQFQAEALNDPIYTIVVGKALADRKTENNSEKPNNCEECKHWNDTEDGCADRHGCRTTTEDLQDWKDRMWAEAIVTEPTTEDCSLVEPQTDCGDFADRLAYERGVKHAWEVAQKVFDSTVTFYEAEDVAKQIDKDINVRSKDEPQNDEHLQRLQACIDCEHTDMCEWCHTRWSKTEPQTELKGSKRLLKGKTEETEMERLERIDNELEDAWARIRELTDEPQTERSE